MTLTEKLGQMTMTASSFTVTGPVIAGDSTESIKNGSLGNLLNMVGSAPVREMQRLAVEESRLGVPLLIGLDVVHGHRTLFPIPIAEAGAFDCDLWERTAREAAREAAADGLAMTFAPMVDVSRDPRWGRTAEGAGEDPWLGRQVAMAKVRGFQSASLERTDAIAATAKHFCAYGAVTAGREYASVDISKRTLHEVHLPPFEGAVRAGVAAIMPAFTDLAGIPLTAHVPLLRGWLRQRMRFDGVIVSDYNAIAELIRHGVAGDITDAAVLALNAGVDIDMMANAYKQGLPIALQQGRIEVAQIDAAVRRVLTLKERLGLFDDPYARGARAELRSALDARRALARDAATRSMVLLKNSRATLPLDPRPRSVLLAGPLADAAQEMRGPWWAAGVAEGHISVLRGLKDAGLDVVHEAGVEISSKSRADYSRAVDACAHAEVIVLCLGEGAEMSGEAASRSNLDLPGEQRAFAQRMIERAHTLHKRVIAVIFSGRPLIVPWLIDTADAVIAAWFLGAEAGHAVADVLLGRASPSGRLTMTWPRALGQVPIFFGERPGGRPDNPDDRFTSKYIDVANSPQFPFGFGLHYGEIEYSNLTATPARARRDDIIRVRITLTNRGARGVRETVFLFTHDPVASVARPVLELKGFVQADVDAGASMEVELTLPVVELEFLGLQDERVLEAGEIELLVGPHADRARLLRSAIQIEVPSPS